MNSVNNAFDLAVAFPLSSLELSRCTLSDEEYQEIYPLSDDKIIDIQNELNKYCISFGKQQFGVQMSMFSDVIIYINTHLVELLIAGILPAAYDLIKNTIYHIVQKAHHFYTKMGRNDPCKNIKIKIGNIDIIAPIPTNLNNEQFELYFDKMIKLVKVIKENEEEKQNTWNCFIIEYEEGYAKLKYKTVLQYASECSARQSK